MLPPQLLAMMARMQKKGLYTPEHDDRPPLENWHGNGNRGRGGHSQRGRGRGRGFGRGSGRGRGRGGQHDSHYGGRQGSFHDASDPSRFFSPSFLEDPWASLLSATPAGMPRAQPTLHGAAPQNQHPPQHPPQIQHHGRVLFQPSFLQDPWASLLVQ
ncbi:TPA: hypothetical protein N0F65_009288 [Lagenidium giganteum]|uniref:Uncharacterized protein n=1 Tax=Lagenidium giganteum TaxID=4803 RepID=A0AAV2YMX4_9STRA|nr:TPA: hypothetical protein N0F65_009288 [Lagenidium giganteum]